MKLAIFFTVMGLFAEVFGAAPRICPLKCPSCTKCDPKKGTCTLPRDYISCTKNTVAGVCYAGICNTKMTLSPKVAVLGKCQEYNCDITNTCVLKPKPEGTDCSTPGVHGGIFVCYVGTCTPVILGLSAHGIFPLRNIGCIGLADGTPCDTNDLNDGETCVAGVCKFPDGSYYGYQPTQLF